MASSTNTTTSSSQATQCLESMGRTIKEERLHDGTVAYTVSRDGRTRLRNFGCAATGLLLWAIIAGITKIASHSKYAWVLLAPGVITFVWLFYTLSIRRVGVIVESSHVMVRNYVGGKKLSRGNIRHVVVRTQEPVGRAKLDADDEKHYLALDTQDGGTTICFFDMKHDVLDDVRKRIEAILWKNVESSDEHDADVDKNTSATTLSSTEAETETESVEVVVDNNE